MEILFLRMATFLTCSQAYFRNRTTFFRIVVTLKIKKFYLLRKVMQRFQAIWLAEIRHCVTTLLQKVIKDRVKEQTLSIIYFSAKGSSGVWSEFGFRKSTVQVLPSRVGQLAEAWSGPERLERHQEVGQRRRSLKKSPAHFRQQVLTSTFCSISLSLPSTRWVRLAI